VYLYLLSQHFSGLRLLGIMNAFELFFSFETKVCPSAPSLPLGKISANLLKAGTETLEFSDDPEEMKRMSKIFKLKRIQKIKESMISRKKKNTIKSLS